jgi:hypothetical protein
MTRTEPRRLSDTLVSGFVYEGCPRTQPNFQTVIFLSHQPIPRCVFVIDHTHPTCKTVKTAEHLSFAHFFVMVVFEGSLQQMTMAQNKPSASVDINSIVAKALEMLDSEELLSLLGDSARVPTPNDPSAEAQGSIARDNTQEQSLHINLRRR